MQLLHRCIKGIHGFYILFDCLIGISAENLETSIEKQLSFCIIAKSVEGIASSSNIEFWDLLIYDIQLIFSDKIRKYEIPQNYCQNTKVEEHVFSLVLAGIDEFLFLFP